MNFQNSETEPTKVGRGGSSFHISFENNSNNNNTTLKNPFLAQNRTIFRLFLLQNQIFRISGRPEFPNFVPEAFNFHYFYQKHIIVCKA